MERAHPRQLGLQGAQLSGVEPGQIVQAVLLGLNPQSGQRRDLFVPGGHQKFAQALVCDSVLFAVPIERMSSSHAQPRLVRPGQIIDASVDHLRIA